jgi:hypothetical protein
MMLSQTAGAYSWGGGGWWNPPTPPQTKVYPKMSFSLTPKVDMAASSAFLLKYDGLSITDQFVNVSSLPIVGKIPALQYPGIKFSDTYSDLPSPLNLDYNLPRANLSRGGEFLDMWRAYFPTSSVLSASITIHDRDGQDQTHTLYAIDDTGTIIAAYGWQESGFYANPINLSVTAPEGKTISSIVLVTEPYGETKLDAIKYEKKL